MRKNCPYCAEEVRAEALRCPHCRSRLRTFDSDSWCRDQPEALVAGVAASLSRAFAVPLSAVRIAFVVLSFVELIGVVAYAALWLVIPASKGEQSILEHVLGRAQVFARRVSAGRCDDRDGAHHDEEGHNCHRGGDVRSSAS